ncbi:MAG: hypothetical protein M5U01_24550 [Ardenticatenaceae bacterium]|nr:hypothetical protein [Ardenticatenaceae bacterium]
MLKITRTARGDYAPTITCDWCGERITHANDANYAWLVDDEGEPARNVIFFTHKQCHHAVNSAPGYPRWLEEELAKLLAFLVDSLGVGREPEEPNG